MFKLSILFSVSMPVLFFTVLTIALNPQPVPNREYSATLETFHGDTFACAPDGIHTPATIRPDKITDKHLFFMFIQNPLKSIKEIYLHAPACTCMHPIDVKSLSLQAFSSSCLTNPLFKLAISQSSSIKSA